MRNALFIKTSFSTGDGLSLENQSNPSVFHGTERITPVTPGMYPDGYGKKRLHDQALLESGQESRRDAFERIAELCQQSSVTVVSAVTSHSGALISQLPETPRTGQTFDVIDVADWLLKNGKIEAAVHEQVPQRKNSTGRYEEFAKVIDAGPILVDESAIHLLHTSGCLDELMWEVARPCRESSRARHVVLHHPAPWSYAFALSFRKAPDLEIGKLSGTQQQLLAEVLTAGCLRFDSAEGSGTSKIWAHDESAVAISSGVVGQLTDARAQAMLQSVVEATNRARAGQRVTESLESILALDSANQLFVASLLHTMSYTEVLPSQEITRLLETSEWYRASLSQMDANAFRDITDFFGELQSRIRGPWDVLLPSAYIDTALSTEMADDRRRELVACGIIAAAAGECPALLYTLHFRRNVVSGC